MPNKVTILTTVKDGVSGSFDKMLDKVEQFGGKSGRAFTVGAIAAKAAQGAFGLAEEAIGGVKDVIEGSISAAEREQSSMAALTTSLKANVPGWDGNTEAIERAEKAGRSLGFTNVETTDALRLAVAATHDQTKAVALLAVAQDLARFKGISLGDAMTALTSIEAGKSRGLAQLGINVKDYATEEERLAAVEKVAQGQAEAYTKTIDGEGAVIAATTDDISAKLGQKLIPIVQEAEKDLLNMLDRSTVGFQQLSDAAGKGSQGAAAQLRVLDAAATRNGVSAAALWAEWQAGGGTLDDAGDRLNGVGQSATLAASKVDDWAAELGDADAAAKAAASGTQGYRDWLLKTASATEIATKSTGDLVDELINHLYGAATNAGKRAGLTQQITDLEAQLKKTKDQRSATIIAGQIADLRGQLLQFDEEQAAAKGPAALEAWLDAAKKKFKNTDAAAYNLVLQLEALARVAGQLPTLNLTRRGATGTQNYGPNAAGGIIPPGGYGTVGEDGIEKIRVDPMGNAIITPIAHDVSRPPVSFAASPSSAGFIAPAAEATVVNLNIAVNAGAVLTPGGVEEIGRTLGPIIARYLQRAGLLPQARPF